LAASSGFAAVAFQYWKQSTAMFFFAIIACYKIKGIEIK